MALEAAAFPHSVLTYSCKDLCNSLAAALTHNYRVLDKQEGGFVRETYNHMGDPLDPPCGNDWGCPSSSMVQHLKWEMIRNTSPEIRGQDQNTNGLTDKSHSTIPAGAEASRRKRRRAKSCKNKEEVENQRMTHIAVERNRRKQMNEYLAVLRSLMPPSYVQRVHLSLSPPLVAYGHGHIYVCV